MMNFSLLKRFNFTTSSQKKFSCLKNAIQLSEILRDGEANCLRKSRRGIDYIQRSPDHQQCTASKK